MIKSYQQNQEGASLIEVLIAILVVSIGLLGLASLQTKSLQSNHSSSIRSNVTHMAYDISEKMRLYRDEAISGEFNTSSNCTDCVLKEWTDSLTEVVGNDVQATITQKVTPNNQFVISIRWNDSRGNISEPDDNNVYQEEFTFFVEL